VNLRREDIFTFLNAHLLLALVLAITNIVLFTRLVLAWNTVRTDSTEQIEEYRANMKTLEYQTAPLRGLPAKVDASNKQAIDFYDKRFPANDSTITAELFDLEQKEHVHATRTVYVYKPALPGLEETGLDLSLTGEYAPVMHYINDLERDKVFFVITGLTLAGQQGGNVNVRLKLTTYIHARNGETPPPTEAAPTKAPAGEGAGDTASDAGGQ
jgi:hypothetical protein